MKELITTFYAFIILILGMLVLTLYTHLEGVWRYIGFNIGLFVIGIPAFIFWEEKIKDWLK